MLRPSLALRALLTLLLAVWSLLEAKAFAATDYACKGASGVLLDQIGDVPSDTDWDAFSWTVSDGTLSMLLSLPLLGQPVPVDHPGVGNGYMEYAWGVAIDVDANRRTGSPMGIFEGAEYQLRVSYFHQRDQPRYLYLDQMQWDVWQHYDIHSWRTVGQPELQADPSADFIVLTAAVPGLTPDSRLMPMTEVLVPLAGTSLWTILFDTSPECTFFDAMLILRSGFES